jgi:hypothetical protein
VKLLATGGASLFALSIFYAGCVHYTDSHQVAIARNWVSGNVWLDVKGGYDITPPWVQVSRIDIRPTRVCITSTARAYNCKLVRFDPQGYREFVASQGFHYYWWANRLSFNWGYAEEYRGIRDILRGYAFAPRSYPFIQFVRVYD